MKKMLISIFTVLSMTLIVPAGNVYASLIVNGDFSFGLTGWQFDVFSPSAATGSVVNGEFAADITADDGVKWHIRLKQINISMNNGESYTLELDARAESARNIAVQVKSSGNSSVWKNLTLSQTMQTYSVTWENSLAAADNYEVLVFLGAQGVIDVTIDNVVLTGEDPGFVEIEFEAEDGVITPPMEILESPDASGGYYVATDIFDQGGVTFTFSVPHDDYYYIHILAQAPDDGSDSYHVLIDGSYSDVCDILPRGHPQFNWDKVNGRYYYGDPRVFNLTAGLHTITFKGRETGAKLDKLVITNNSGDLPLIPAEPVEVQFIYLIPNNRTPQPNARSLFQTFVLQTQEFIADQMDRHGFGRKTFGFKTESDGVTPVIDFHYAPHPDYYFHDFTGYDHYMNCLDYLKSVDAIDTKKPYFLIPETHIMNPDGSFIPGTVIARGGAVGGNCIQFFDLNMLQNDSPYDGSIIPGVGPYPLEGDATFSERSAGTYHFAMHEFTHNLGLTHDPRNDDKPDIVNIMGGIGIGVRGNIFPILFPENYGMLARASALIFNTNHAFNPDRDSTEFNAPILTVHTSGTVPAQNGRIPISFTATDDSELAFATLIFDPDDPRAWTVDHLELSGDNVTTEMYTEVYDPGVSNGLIVNVYDIYGNRASTKIHITPEAGYNRAPEPHVRLDKYTVEVGEPVTLDASKTNYFGESSAAHIFEWDTDGDGTFDEHTGSSPQLVTYYNQPGTYLIQVKITDPQGAYSISSELPIRVIEGTQSNNLILNGHFSSGLDNWSTESISPAEADFSVTGGELLTDIINDDSTNWHIKVSQAGITLENGKSYTLTFDARAESPRNLITQIKLDHPPRNGIVWETHSLSETMRSYTVNWTQSAATDTYKLLFFLGSEGEKDVWLDNVVITEN